MGTTNTTQAPPQATPKSSIDNNITKLKNGFKELHGQINNLEKRLFPILSKDQCDSPNVEYIEEDGKLDTELFNMNQDLGWAIETISTLTSNVETRGEF